jgi:hypothetical protein
MSSKRRPVLDLAAIMAASRKSAAGSMPGVKALARPGHVRGRMNGLERSYSEYLDGEVAAGRVIKYRFESVSLVLARPPAGGKAVTWTPDFWVVLADRSIELVDTKGGLERAAQRAKIKIAADVFDEFFVVVLRRIKGTWQREVIS